MKASGASGQDRISAYQARILEVVKPELERIGYGAIRWNRRTSVITVNFPRTLDLSKPDLSAFTINATRADASVRLHFGGFETKNENSAALDVLRERYGERLSRAMPGGAKINWHTGSGPRQDKAMVVLPGAGYEDGSADDTARWAVEVLRAWMDVLRDDPITDLSSLVEDWVVHHEEASRDLSGDGNP